MQFQNIRFFIAAVVLTWPFWASSPASADDRQTLRALTSVEAAEAGGQSVAKTDWLSQFYHDTDHRRIWTGSRRSQKRLAAYLDTLKASSTLGFDTELYGLSHLQRLAASEGQADQAQLELDASRSFAEFALDTRDGRISPRIDFTEDELAGRETEKASFLRSIQQGKSPEQVMTALRRDNPLQTRLIKALAEYARLAKDGGWEAVEISSDALETGDTGLDVEHVAERLRLEGFFKADLEYRETAPSAAPTDASSIRATEASQTATKAKHAAYFDEGLAEAVEAFQISRGIEPDGIVGPDTLARMNEPVEALIDNIKLNLERARWLPQDFSERYVLVNIAAYSTVLYEKERLQSRIRTVVGKDHQQTPVFAGSMSYMVVNPYWNIPESIVRNEIAPNLREDLGYLSEKNMELVDGWGDNPNVIDAASIDWSDLPTPLGFRMRQKPGETNSLGLVKFMFPNEYSVYLHDTPADALFDKTKRAFSHGCIRLADPIKFANWVLEETEGYDGARVEEIIAGGERTVIQLDQEIPVYITYFTAWSDVEGNIFFYDDIYKRDRTLRQAIEKSRRDYAGGVASALE